jgi:hypothetical protein
MQYYFSKTFYCAHHSVFVRSTGYFLAAEATTVVVKLLSLCCSLLPKVVCNCTGNRISFVNIFFKLHKSLLKFAIYSIVVVVLQ